MLPACIARQQPNHQSHRDRPNATSRCRQQSEGIESVNRGFWTEPTSMPNSDMTVSWLESFCK